MKKLIQPTILFLMILAFGLFGCNQSNSELEGIPVEDLVETKIPGFENIITTPTGQENYFPMTLSCGQIDLKEIRPGYTRSYGYRTR